MIRSSEEAQALARKINDPNTPEDEREKLRKQLIELEKNNTEFDSIVY